MALFKIFKGNDINRLNNPNDPNYRVPIDGYAYYNTDNQEFYIDTYYRPTNSQIENNDSRIITNENDPNYGLLLDRRPINAHYAYSAGYDGASSPQKIHKTYIKNLEIKNNQLSYITGDGTSHSVEGTLGAVTGVKGNAETTYRTGQVNLTPANIGAAASGHTHTTTIATDNGTNQLTLAFGTKYKLTAGGTSYIFTMPANPDTDTASAVDNILDGSNSGTAITYAPYTSQQTKLSFDTSTIDPIRTDRLNLNGYLYATKLYSGGEEVLTTHQDISGKVNKAGDTMTGGLHLVGNQNSAWNDKGIIFTNGSRIGENTSKDLGIYSGGSTVYIRADSATSASGKGIEISSTSLIPSVTNEMTLGTTSRKWKNIYATTFTGNLTGNASSATKATQDSDGEQINTTYLKLSGGTMTGALTLNGDPTSNLHAATKQYVDNILTTNDAMVFKGVLGTDTDSGMISSLPPNTIDSSYKQGWTYKVGTAGTYAGQDCEIGDTIYCIADGTTANDANWTVIQTNIDGYVIGPTTSTTNGIAIYTGNTGKGLSDSGKTITESAPTNSSDNTTIPTSEAVWNAISGASGYGKTGTVTSVRVQASNPLQSSTSTAQSTSLNTTISFKNQNANTVLAGPSSGSAAAPTFRALVAADIPKVNNATTADKTIAANLTTTTNAIAKYSDTIGTFADSGVTIDANNNITAPTTAYIKAGTFQIGGSGQKVTNKIKSSDTFYIDRADQTSIIFQYNGASKIWIDQPNNNFRPDATNSLNIGTTTYAWKSVFISTNATTDNGLAFSNGSNVLGRIGVNTSGAMALSVPDGQGIHLRPHPTNTNLDFIVNKNEVQLLNIPKINLTDNSDDTKSVSIVFNSTTNALDFIFA